MRDTEPLSRADRIRVAVVVLGLIAGAVLDGIEPSTAQSPQDPDTTQHSPQSR